MGLEATVEKYIEPNGGSEMHSEAMAKVVAALKDGEIDILGLVQLLGGALQGTDEIKRRRGAIAADVRQFAHVVVTEATNSAACCSCACPQALDSSPKSFAGCRRSYSRRDRSRRE